MVHFDVAIIGSGSGNSLPGPDWGSRKVAIIDGGTFGGTCLNVGCIPTKMFVYPADLAEGARDAGRLGVDMEVRNVRWREIRDRIFERIDAISTGGMEYRQHGNPNVTLFPENVEFTGPRTLRTASGQDITAENIVVAAGSRPLMPDFDGQDLPQVHTSDTVMRIGELPRRVLIVGGGFVAAEFAHVFSSLGSRVSILTRSRGLLKRLDAEIARRFEDAVAGQMGHPPRLRIGFRAACERPARRCFRGAGSHCGLFPDALVPAGGSGPRRHRPAPEHRPAQIAAAGFDQEPGRPARVDKYQRVLSGGDRSPASGRSATSAPAPAQTRGQP